MRLFISLLLLINIWSTAYADAPIVAVVHYKAPDQYKPIINDIVGGVEDAVDSDVIRIIIDKNDDSSLALVKSLSPSIPIISITPTVHSKLKELNLTNKQILGATTSRKSLDNTIIASLTAPMTEIISSLQSLAADKNRIHYFHHPHDALLTRTETINGEEGSPVEIIDYPVNSTSEALLGLKHLFEENLKQSDAIYIESDVVSHNPELIIKYLVEQSWRYRTPVITNSSSLVKQGLLFALVPDYIEHGRLLGRLATEVTQNNYSIRHTPSSALLINRRTLLHLGLPTPESTIEREVIYVGTPY